MSLDGGRTRRSVSGMLYLACVVVLASFAFVPQNPNAELFSLLFVFSLPVSVFLLGAIYAVAATTGADNGPLLRLVVLLVWVLAVWFQLVLFRAVRTFRAQTITGDHFETSAHRTLKRDRR